MLLLALIVALIAVLWLGMILYNLLLSPLKGVPGPLVSQIFPLYDVVHMLRGTFHEHMLNMHQLYGPIVRIAGDRISVADPQSIKLIHGSYAFKKSKFYEHVNAKGRSMVSLNDRQEHTIRRRAIARVFSDANTDRLEAQVMSSGVNPLISKINETCSVRSSDNQSSTVSISSEFHLMALDIIGQLIFGQNLGLLAGLDHPILAWHQKVFAWSILNAMLPPLRLIGNLPLKKIYKFAEASVNQRQLIAKQQGWKHADILTGLMLAKDPISGEGISKVDLCEEITGLLLAGSDSTSHTLTWTMYSVLTNPPVKQRLEEEIRSKFTKGSDGELVEPTWSTIQSDLPYTNAVIKESMRLLPVASLPILRVSPGSNINQHYIPRGTEVFTMIYTAHRNPEYWPNPSQFDPNRWLSSSSNADKEEEQDNHLFHPFLVGPRSCPGRNLAMMELSLTLVYLFLHFDLELAPEHPPLIPVAHMVLKPGNAGQLLINVTRNPSLAKVH